MGTRDDSRVRTARKVHRCCVCRKVIDYGTKYLDYKIGLMDSSRVHLICAEHDYLENNVYGCDALIDYLNEKRAAVSESSPS